MCTVQQNGKVTGLLEFVTNGTVDTLALTFGTTAERREVLAFTQPLYYVSCRC